MNGYQFEPDWDDMPTPEEERAAEDAAMSRAEDMWEHEWDLAHPQPVSLIKHGPCDDPWAVPGANEEVPF